jgi:hypothetical protein
MQRIDDAPLAASAAPGARCMAAGAIRATSSSSISTVTIAVRITEGSDQIQIRNVAGYMFGFIGKNRPRN